MIMIHGQLCNDESIIIEPNNPCPISKDKKHHWSYKGLYTVREKDNAYGKKDEIAQHPKDGSIEGELNMPMNKMKCTQCGVFGLQVEWT